MDGHEVIEIMLSALERTKRIDAEFYKKENLAVDAILSAWNKKSFADCFYISDGNHMGITDSFCEDGIPYYRGQDIYNLFIETASPLMINRTTYEKPQMHRSHLQKGDILMSIVGAIVGNSAMVTSDEPATCSCKLSIMRSKNNGIAPELLLVYIKTRYGQVQIQKFKRGAAQTGLLLEDFDQLYIPEFGKCFQDRICQAVQIIYRWTTESVARYDKAQQLFNHAIDLDTITTTGAISVKTLKQSFMLSGRLDAEFYLPKFDALFAILNKHKTRCLGGDNGLVSIRKSIEPGSDAYCDTGIPFVRVSDISKFEITKPEIHLTNNFAENIEMLYPKKDTILFSKDGSVGIAYKVKQDETFVTSSAILHLTVKDTSEVLPDYLALVLNSQVVQMQAERDSSGAIIQHWKPSEIERVVIPMLEMSEQEKIVKMVRESFMLRSQSKLLLDHAQHAVEMAIERGEGAALAWLNSKISQLGAE